MFEGAMLKKWCLLAATSALLATGCTSQQANDESIDSTMSALGGSLTVSGTAPVSANDGTDIQYALSYKNGTSLPTTATTVAFTVPAHTTYVSTSGTLICTTPIVGQSGVVSCAVGTAGIVGAGATGSFNVSVHIAAGTTGTIDATTYSVAALGISAQAGAAMHTTVTQGIPAADLGVAVTASASTAVWGQALSYTVVATNDGPNAVSGATVSDAFPASFTNVAWSCTASSGASCAASGTGNIADSSVVLPVNGKVTYTVTGNVGSGTGAATLVDTATVAVPSTASDTITSNNASSASVSLSSPNGITCNTGIECASGVCSSLAHLCIPAAGCGVDSDCSSDKFCNTVTYQCVSKLANGTPIPALLGHTPTILGVCANATVGNIVCASAVCDSKDNQCGYASGDGSCTSANAATVCRSGACSTNGTCMPMGTCNLDSDCASTSYCNVTAHTCTSKVANGQPIPIDLFHGATALLGLCTPGAATAACQSGVCDIDNLCGYGNGDGTCTSANASSVCRSGACDGTDGKCGYANGDGPCSGNASLCRSNVCSADGKCGYGTGDGPCLAINAGTVCRTGICATTGALAGKCELCASDLNCSDSAPACDPLSAACVACTATNLLGCKGATPVCDLLSSSCKRCNGDLGSGASLSCGSVLSPTCTNGSCGRCVTNDDCVGSHNGPICNALTGACGSTCTLDTDCGGNQWCDAGSCTAKLANGDALPSEAPFLGLCTPVIASRICQSGVCDVDGKCGFANGDGLCNGTTGPTVCRSQQCDTKGLLGALLNTCQECNGDAACAGKAGTPACNPATDRCVQCTADNTSACTGSTPVCNTILNLCAPCVGDFGSGLPTACSSAAAPYCSLGGACSLCTTNNDCALGHAGPICDATTGSCGTQCASDSDCTLGNWCNASAGGKGSCVPKLANGTHLPSAPSDVSSCQAGVGARVCASGVCDADDKCGRANGSACTGLLDCRILVCTGGTCGLPVILPGLDGGTDAGNDAGSDAGSGAGADDDAGSDAGVSVGVTVDVQINAVDPRDGNHYGSTSSGTSTTDAGASGGTIVGSDANGGATDQGSVGGSCSATPTEHPSDALGTIALVGLAAFFGMRRRSKKAA